MWGTLHSTYQWLFKILSTIFVLIQCIFRTSCYLMDGFLSVMILPWLLYCIKWYINKGKRWQTIDSVYCMFFFSLDRSYTPTHQSYYPARQYGMMEDMIYSNQVKLRIFFMHGFFLNCKIMFYMKAFICDNLWWPSIIDMVNEQISKLFYIHIRGGHRLIFLI